MKLYRFSPIKTKAELFKAIKHVLVQCHKLCKQSFGGYLENAGNMGIFCHYDDEYEFLTNLRQQLTEPSANPDQKYFELIEPITFTAKEIELDIPKTTYTHLYIRRPDPYRAQVGDVDFYLPEAEYVELKQELFAGKEMVGTRVFDRPDLDMIELYDPDVDALAYVSTEKMTQTVRVKQSELTKL